MVLNAFYLSLLASSTRTSSSSSLLENQIKPLKEDIQFHSWCEAVGIVNSPTIQLATSPLSVAGRGVFAVDFIPQGEPLVTIPPHCVLTPKVAAQYFPDVAEDLNRKLKRSKGWFSRLVQRHKTDKANCDDEYWQPELTAYALAAVESENNPWAEWICQWNRDDPILRLFEDGVQPSDGERISAVADELKSMLPELSQLELQAAIQIRLQRFEEHRSIFFNDNSNSFSRQEIARMYAILGSRALDLGDDINGVVPMYDMINHSLDPNLVFAINEDYNLQLFASRDIYAGEELFLCYNNLEQIDRNGWTELNALWTLVQWGIPVANEVADEQLMKRRQRSEKRFEQ